VNNFISVDYTATARSSNDVCRHCKARQHDKCVGIRRAEHGLKLPCWCRTCKKAATAAQERAANAPTGDTSLSAEQTHPNPHQTAPVTQPGRVGGYQYRNSTSPPGAGEIPVKSASRTAAEYRVRTRKFPGISRPPMKKRATQKQELKGKTKNE
jgi:cobalamin biosynthesis Mg chelatase CobN